MDDLTTDLALTGSGMVADGVGLLNQASGVISVDVPAGATVNHALLYWELRDDAATDPDLMRVSMGGTTEDVTGTFIGESVIDRFNDSHSFRADITSLFPFGPGTNTITVEPLGGNPNGAALVLVYDDGTGAFVEVRDGDDFAYLPWALAANAQVFTFPASTTARQADLWFLVGDIEGSRPSRIEITVDGAVTQLVNVMGDGTAARDGSEWDTYNTQVNVPAGVTQLTLQVFSHDDATDLTPASLIWVASGVSIQDPPVDGGQGCTPGYWGQEHHYPDWTAPYTPATLFSTVFDDAFPDLSLVDVVNLGGGGLNALGRHTVAALLNAASPEVAYDMTTGDVISAFNAVFLSGDYETLKDELEALNELGCPLDNSDGSNANTNGVPQGPNGPQVQNTNDTEKTNNGNAYGKDKEKNDRP